MLTLLTLVISLLAPLASLAPLSLALEFVFIEAVATMSLECGWPSVGVDAGLVPALKSSYPALGELVKGSPLCIAPGSLALSLSITPL